MYALSPLKKNVSLKMGMKTTIQSYANPSIGLPFDKYPRKRSASLI
ncbi:hypothetical protein M092_2460 [Parabacteroides distasonis str. 3776 D15 iv]|uniref:Uncharacterized protein n=1 Tax=Parabacteroides distasonis str. 3776 D15 i TaxID=1339342 RepID=A0AB34L3X8_PARDI|nr:hypothetical protein M091_2163 [Parabacteroides distasonis str. 3776 D15 i]KDS45354.1 hypothetical protein M090_4174 [Parabacteroides distasonis str. 3776 Po2 i]KDS70785.1 hypothetical protein M092_2460 [Parabacteroides distasonis str. 3776 D15 iv]